MHRESNPNHYKILSQGSPLPVTARKDDAPTALQAVIANVAEMASFSGGGGLIQTTSGCRQQRVLRLHRRGCCWRARS